MPRTLKTYLDKRVLDSSRKVTNSVSKLISKELLVLTWLCVLIVSFAPVIFYSHTLNYKLLIAYGISTLYLYWGLDLSLAPLRERNNHVDTVKSKHIIVLYLRIFNIQNWVLFKFSASGSFLKYSYNLTNFSLNILIKYIDRMHSRGQHLF